MFENSAQPIGINSDVAFSFIVQEPNGIIECVNERSLFSKLFMYRNIPVSERCRLNTGCVRYSLARWNGAGYSSSPDSVWMSRGLYTLPAALLKISTIF